MTFNRTNGYTFVELLTVLFIIGLLVAISLGVARYATVSSDKARVRTDLNLVADALDRFYLEFGEYPQGTTVSNLLAYSQELVDNGETFHFARLLPVGFSGKDPWKTYYRYKVIDEGSRTDEESSPFFILKSSGPDRKEGTADDISYP